jgi:hypothetical protein
MIYRWIIENNLGRFFDDGQYPGLVIVISVSSYTEIEPLWVRIGFIRRGKLEDTVRRC